MKIGGPASSVWDNGAIEEFIKYAATNNLPIDFITWHMYAGWNNFGDTNQNTEKCRILSENG
ncbi:MAG: hypothetical protein HS132_03070 [Planctomycetia bacterium]|nr:hypothetical protein [Planctomycetia bacterium]